MKNNRIRITENELKQVVAESVKRILREAYIDTPYGRINTGPLKHTFDDEDIQTNLKNDTIEIAF